MDDRKIVRELEKILRVGESDIVKTVERFKKEIAEMEKS